MLGVFPRVGHEQAKNSEFRERGRAGCGANGLGGISPGYPGQQAALLGAADAGNRGPEGRALRRGHHQTVGRRHRHRPPHLQDARSHPGQHLRRFRRHDAEVAARSPFAGLGPDQAGRPDLQGRRQDHPVDARRQRRLRLPCRPAQGHQGSHGRFRLSFCAGIARRTGAHDPGHAEPGMAVRLALSGRLLRLAYPVPGQCHLSNGLERRHGARRREQGR